MGRRVLRRHIWGYSVCLCPIKGTPGLNELICVIYYIFTTPAVKCPSNYYGWDCTQRCYCQNPTHCERFTGPTAFCRCREGFFNEPFCEPGKWNFTSGKRACAIYTLLNPTFKYKNWGMQGYTYFSYFCSKT